MDNLKQFPITLQEGKRLAKIRLGRLPRPGYSVVIGGVFNGNPPLRNWDYQLLLENYAGKIILSCWQRPFITVDLSQFQTIDGERDSRS